MGADSAMGVGVGVSMQLVRMRLRLRLLGTGDMVVGLVGADCR